MPAYNKYWESGSRNINDWKDDNVTFTQIRKKEWLLSIKPIINFSKITEKRQIPPGYEIIKPGETIPNEYWYNNYGDEFSNLDIRNWTKGSGNLIGHKRGFDNDIFIRKSINNEVNTNKKKYTLELTEEQYKVLSEVFSKEKLVRD